MSHSEVLLLKPIDGLGGEGDLVKVRAGYARNYLLPLHFAVPVNLANRRHIESLKTKRISREAKDLEGARDIAARLKNVTLAFAVKTGDGGKMFGSITQADIFTKLVEQGYPVEKKRVHIAGGHVKTLGKHEATVKLHADISVEVAFEVVSENPIVEVAKPAEAPLGKDGKPRKPRRDEGGEGQGHAPVERKSAVEMLLDSLGEAPAAAKPSAAGDDKANKGKKKKPKGKGKKSDE
jgi:large subunit ribosomal protein L9